MIRCTKCKIDYDLCPCGDEPAKSNLLSAYGGFIFFLILLWLMVGATSCNSAKQAQRNIHRAEMKNPNELAKWCATRYNPIDSINTVIEYRQGDVITDTIITTEIEIVRDTVVIKATKVITNTIHDTVFSGRYERAVNSAAIDSMKNWALGELGKKEKEITDLKVTVAKKQKSLSIAMWFVIILGAYTLGRWVLRIWNIKIP